MDALDHALDVLHDAPHSVTLEGAFNVSFSASISGSFNGTFDVIVGDLSFISQTLVLPALVPLLKPGAALLIKLRAVRQQLYAIKPEFCSVTFGAGGSTQAGTFAPVGEILAEGVGAASHFSCVGATKATVREQLATLKAMGVKRLVTLRGDLPCGYGAGGEFHFASDLVEFIRAETGSDFRIEVAAYPEIHPQAKSPEADL